MLENTNTKQTYPGPILNTTLQISTFLFKDPEQVKLTKTYTNDEGIQVEENLTYGTDYEVTKTLADDISTADASLTASAGEILLKPTVSVLAGQKLTAYRESELTQEVSYPRTGPFPAKTHEGALDYLTMQNQEQQEQLNRSLKMPISTQDFSGVLPNPEPGKALTIASDGKSLVYTKYNLDEAFPIVEQNKDSAINAAILAQQAYLQTESINSTAKIWAEGTDSEVHTIGGMHSAKGWVERINKETAFVSVKNFGAVGNNINDDTAAIQKAINNIEENQVIFFPQGIYKITNSLKLKKNLTFFGNNAILQTQGDISLFITNESIWPGRITFQNLIFKGDNKLGKAIDIKYNTPMIYIQNCSFSSFEVAILLDDAYNSQIENCFINACNIGILLKNATHTTTLLNNMIDNCAEYALKINDATSTNTTHNITIIGGAYQCSNIGIDVIKAYEVALYNTYFERNNTADIRLGTTDSATYNYAVYNSLILNANFSSTCADANIILNSCVSANLQGLAFNNNSEVCAIIDGYCDKILLDYQRLNNSSSPFSISGDAIHKVIIRNNGLILNPSDNYNVLQFGNLANFTQQKSFIARGTTSAAGRKGLQFISAIQDMVIGTPDILKFVSTSTGINYNSWTERIIFDFLNKYLILSADMSLRFAGAAGAFSDTNATIIHKTGAFCPAYITDANAPSNSIYYSTTQNALCYKNKNNHVYSINLTQIT